MNIKPLIDLLLSDGASDEDSHKNTSDQNQAIENIKESLRHRNDEMDRKLAKIAQNQERIYSSLNTRVKSLEDNFSKLRVFVEQNTDDLQHESLSTIEILERLDLLEYSGRRFKIPKWARVSFEKVCHRLPEIYMFCIGCTLSGAVAAAIFWIVSNTN
jgi:hypothetical protein